MKEKRQIVWNTHRQHHQESSYYGKKYSKEEKDEKRKKEKGVLEAIIKHVIQPTG